MAIMATRGSEGGNFEPAPQGVHQAVCVDVIDKGILEVTYAGETKKQHKIVLSWQIDETREDGKPFLVSKRYTLSLNEKATLRKDLESWRGRAFTRDEEAGFDVESVLGANCLLNIQHKTVGDKTYANVVSIMPIVKNMGKIAAKGYVRLSEREPEHTTNIKPPADDFGGGMPDDDQIPFNHMENY